LAPLAAMVSLFLPTGLSQQVDTLYEIREQRVESKKAESGASAVASKTQRLTIEDRLLNLLATRGPLRGRQIDTHFARVDWRKTAQFLVRRGTVSAKSVLPPPRVRAKHVRVTQLAVTPE